MGFNNLQKNNSDLIYPALRYKSIVWLMGEYKINAIIAQDEFRRHIKRQSENCLFCVFLLFRFRLSRNQYRNRRPRRTDSRRG